MDEETQIGWMTGLVECRLCEHRHVAVAPAETNLENLQCAKCGNLTCDRVPEDEVDTLGSQP